MDRKIEFFVIILFVVVGHRRRRRGAVGWRSVNQTALDRQCNLVGFYALCGDQKPKSSVEFLPWLFVSLSLLPN